MKERRYREAEMSPAVVAWLKGLGYSVYAEVPALGTCDHVGIRWSDMSIICVEMKCSLTWKVLMQAHAKTYLTPLVYVAVPGVPRKASIEKAAGRGLGVWACGRVIAEPSPRIVYPPNKHLERLLEFCRKAPEGGIGGMPTIKGDGPAIRCAAAVRAYLQANPSASWKEIHRNVPNHYAHARSMAGALPLVRNPQRELAIA